jgi:hypothetical protein
VIAKKETLMKAIGYLSIVALTAACLEARANGAIENVLVTGTYSPTNALTSAVSVLDEQQIRALNKRTVAGLLKTLPGVLVEEQGGPGGLTAVSIRGGEANFTLVLLDGVALNDPTNFRGGGFDFADLSTALVWSASRWCEAPSPPSTVPMPWRGLSISLPGAHPRDMFSSSMLRREKTTFLISASVPRAGPARWSTPPNWRAATTASR